MNCYDFSIEYYALRVDNVKTFMKKIDEDQRKRHQLAGGNKKGLGTRGTVSPPA